jgi:hypothetical protein
MGLLQASWKANRMVSCIPEILFQSKLGLASDAS